MVKIWEITFGELTCAKCIQARTIAEAMHKAERLRKIWGYPKSYAITKITLEAETDD